MSSPHRKADREAPATESSASLPHDETEEQPKAPAERLVIHLLASKRSLSAINDVWRANELVTNARETLEASVILSARTGFIKKGLNETYRILHKVKTKIGDVKQRGQDEYEACLDELDDAERRLQATLSSLRITTVETSINREPDKRKVLFDYVDDDGIKDVLKAAEMCIDSTQAAQRKFEDSLNSFEEDLVSISEELPPKNIHASSSSSFEQASQPDLRSPIPKLLNGLETHAKEMASLLESLVRHFDLCVTALKYTEGSDSSAAVQKITDSLPPGLDLTRNSNSAVEAPPTEEERTEMMSVLEKDASEVEDVVLEIHDRLSEMEQDSMLISEHLSHLAAVHATVLTIYQRLINVGAKLQSYRNASKAFEDAWAVEATKIRTLLDEMASLREFYTGFKGAYDNLLIEVARRHTLQGRMEATMKEAQAKVSRMYDDDVRAREVFRIQQGDYLPADIWPGLLDPPPKFAVKRLKSHDDVTKKIEETI
ncbi:MAG: autophagy protein 17 [Vezdaea acicularis]|nr:MAG: autophagy protein 17 [Vezdaea acicularis]